MNTTTPKLLKTIPKKIMGYLKFAHFIINNPQSDIIHTLFLDQSIEEIVALVNDVVVNGEQDKVIIDLRKQFIHASNPPKPKAKPRSKKTNADLIVDDLVTLARDPEPKNPEPQSTKKRSTKKIPVADPVPVTNHLEQDIFVNDPLDQVQQVDPVDQLVNDHVDQVVNDHVEQVVVNDRVEQVVKDHVDQVVKDPVVAPKAKKGKKPVNVPENPENEIVPEVPVPEEKNVTETKKKNKKPVVEKPVI